MTGTSAHFQPPSAAPCWNRTEQFFSPNSEQQRAAKQLCAGCPQWRPCLAGALERRERDGVWGGVVMPTEARVLRRGLAAAAAGAGAPLDYRRLAKDWTGPSLSDVVDVLEPSQAAA